MLKNYTSANTTWNTNKAIQVYNGAAWTSAKAGYVYDGSLWRIFYPEAPANTAAPAMTGYNILYSAPPTPGNRPYVEYPAQISVSNGTWTNSPTKYEYTFQESPYPNPSFSWTTLSGPSTSANSLNISGRVSGSYYQALVKATNIRGAVEVTATGATVQAPPYVPTFNFSNDWTTGLTTLSWGGDFGGITYGGQGYHLYYYYVGVVPTFNSFTSDTTATFNYLSYQNSNAGFTLMGMYISSYRSVTGYPGPNGTNYMSGFYHDIVAYFPPYPPTGVSNGYGTFNSGYYSYAPAWSAGAYGANDTQTYTLEIYGTAIGGSLGGTLYATYSNANSGSTYSLPDSSHGGYTFYSVRVQANSTNGKSQWSAYAPAT
jgi:hypothetical protein